MAKKQTLIWSIFGQIDEIVAREMVKEGKFNQVPGSSIPESQKTSEEGFKVRIAVIVPVKYVKEYEERVKLLLS
jgi:hypothetical protein